jgi:hypothetical protein
VPCPVCDKTFGCQKSLRRHVHVHDETFDKFDCDECGQRFTRLDSVQRHAKKKHVQPSPPAEPVGHRADDDGVLSMKALTLPIVFDDDVSISVTDAEHDTQLLFLCPVDPTADVSSSYEIVELQLHALLHWVRGSREYSAPYRMLKLSHQEFLMEVVDNGCVLPRRLLLEYTVPPPTSSSSSQVVPVVKQVMDVECHFATMYQHVNHAAYELFILSYYHFQHGLGDDVALIRAVFRIFDRTAKSPYTADPTQRCHVLRYLVRRCSHVSLDAMLYELRRFTDLVDIFKRVRASTGSRCDQL